MVTLLPEMGVSGTLLDPQVTNLYLQREHMASSRLLASPGMVSHCRVDLQGFTQAFSEALGCNKLFSSLNSWWSMNQRAPKDLESLGLFGSSVLPTERNNEHFLSRGIPNIAISFQFVMKTQLEKSRVSCEMAISGLTSDGEGDAPFAWGRLGEGCPQPPRAGSEVRLLTAASLPDPPGASSRTWRRPPTAWRKGQTSPRTGGASGPSGRRAPGRAGEASSPRSGTACGRGTAPARQGAGSSSLLEVDLIQKVIAQ